MKFAQRLFKPERIEGDAELFKPRAEIFVRRETVVGAVPAFEKAFVYDFYAEVAHADFVEVGEAYAEIKRALFKRGEAVFSARVAGRLFRT